MRLRHAALAALASIAWGFAFVVIRYGLASFTPPQLTALRFIVAAGLASVTHQTQAFFTVMQLATVSAGGDACVT